MKEFDDERWPAVAVWNSAERSLLDANCDVLTIFDTCLASNLMLSDVKPNVTWADYIHSNGIFEHIGASGKDRGVRT